MSYSVEVGLSDLVRLDPRAAKVAVRALLRGCQGQPTKAAEAVGVSHATVKRWIERFGLRDDVELYRRKAGLRVARTDARGRRGQVGR